MSISDSNFQPFQKTNGLTNIIFYCNRIDIKVNIHAKIVNEYDPEIPQSQTADNPVALEEEPLNHHETPGRQIKQSNQLSSPSR